MSRDQERDNNRSCCGPGVHHGHPDSGRKLGILLIAAGAIWLGTTTGLLDFSWLRGFPFWPAALILLGAWWVYRSTAGGKPETILAGKDGRHGMEATFAGMMEGCMTGMSDQGRKKMMALCGEKMAGICPCMGAKEMSAEERKAMMEKMMAFCGSKMELMAACFGKRETASQNGGPEKSS